MHTVRQKVWVVIVCICAIAACLPVSITPSLRVAPAYTHAETNGIQIRTLMREAVDPSTAQNSYLTLKRVNLSRNQQYEINGETSPTFFNVSVADAQLQDSQGLTKTIATGTSMNLPAGSFFSLTSAGDSETVLLTQTIDDADYKNANSRGMILSTLPITEIEINPRAFITEISLPANTEPQTFADDGAVSVFVDAGAVDFMSPGGIVGQSLEDNSFIVDAGNKLIFGSETGAKTLLIGISHSNGDPVNEIGKDGAGTNTSDQTSGEVADVETSETPTLPTVRIGDPWVGPEGTITVTVEKFSISTSYSKILANDTPGQFEEGERLTDGVAFVRINVTFTNTTDTQVDFPIDRSAVQLTDDKGLTWLRRSGDGEDIVGQQVSLAPGESMTLSDFYYGGYDLVNDTRTEASQYVADVTIRLFGFPGIPEARWGFVWNHGKLLVPLTPPSTTDIAYLLPEGEVIPQGLIHFSDEEYKLDVVKLQYPDEEYTRELFESLGWQENKERMFNVEDATVATPSDTNFVQVRIHLFADDKSAQAAAEYTAGIYPQYFTTYEQLIVDPVGDWSTAFFGTYDGGNATRLIVRRGPMMILVYATSPEGNPTQEVWNIANDIVQRSN